MSRMFRTLEATGCQKKTPSWLMKVGLRTLAAAGFVAALTGSASAATVVTDQADYAAGDAVIVAGSDWVPGERVALEFVEDSLIHPTDTLYAIADGAGNIYDEYVIAARDTEQTFTLTATGQSTGVTAQTTFTGSADTSLIAQPLLDSSTTTTTFATVTTDKDEYIPGETVFITGSGPEPGEEVELKLVGDPLIHPGETLYATADAAGNLEAQYIVQDYDLGRTFTLTATGQSSGLMAQTTFKDADHDVKVKSNANNVTFGLTWMIYDSTDCTGMSLEEGVVGSVGGTGSTNFQKAVNTNQSIQLVAAQTSNERVPFAKWTGPASFVPTTSLTICVPGPTNTAQYEAVYSAPADNTPPVISCGSADGNWHASDVNIACTANDGGSGLANSADASFSLSTQVPAGMEEANASTDSRKVCDAAGNCATAGPISGNKIDKKAPVQQSCESADGVWHNDNITLHCTYTDGGSGPASQTLNLTTNVPVGSEDGNASASTNGQACDAVNNCATVTPVTGNKIDRKAPSFSCGAADGSWHGTDQSVNCTASDGGSGLGNPSDASFSLSTNVAAGTETDSAVTNSHQVCDAVNNCATADGVGPFKIDKKAPDLDATAAVNGSLYTAGAWTNQDVTVSFTCSDGGSGVANVTEPTTVSTEGPNQSVSGTCADKAGNSASTTFSGINIDKTPPSVRITGVTDGETYYLDSVLDPTCNTEDGLSGVVTYATLTVSGGNENGVGTFTATCQDAVDKAGNTKSASVTYYVHYNYSGFYRPVDNLPVLNVVKAGSAIPVKFSLSGDWGLSVFADGYPRSAVTTYDSTAPVGAIDQTITAGSSSLSYDPTTDQYTYVWKTDKAWAGTYRQLVVRLNDGAEYRANFKFAK